MPELPARKLFFTHTLLATAEAEAVAPQGKFRHSIYSGGKLLVGQCCNQNKPTPLL